MHKNRILFLREPEVDTILRRCLSKIGYRICPKVRLSDAIVKDQGEWLPSREFEYLCKAHLDFLIVKNDFPVFAVEFDGLQHLEDPDTIARDVMKNRLCKAADLPLLRITSREIFKRDEITILDYMLMRYVAWQDEIADIMAEIKVYADTIGPDANPDDLCVDLDPGFHFDLRHPFPATKTVLERLWRNHQIAWDMVGDSRRQKARFLCDVGSRRSGQLHHDQFHTCELTVIAWAPSASLSEPIHSETVSVTIRSWLPLLEDVPEPDFLFAGSTLAELRNSVERFKIRAQSMWFPQLPGISAWDISENYAEYLGFRAIEGWAKGKRTDRGAAGVV